MIHLLEKADIFSLDVQAIVNPVNCVGVMGGGLAKAFADRYPAYLKRYKKLCEYGLIEIGRPFFHMIGYQPPKHRFSESFIVSFATKLHWKDPSKLGYIVDAMQKFCDSLNGFEVESVAIPALGCGLGGLKWEKVRPVIENGLTGYKGNTYLIAPQ